MASLTTGNISSSIFKFALPMLIGNVFQQFYNIVDAVIVGQYLGKEALAGVLTASPVIMLVTSLIIGVAMGGTVVISHFYGAGKYEQVQQTSETITLFVLTASLVLGVVGYFLCPYILQLMQVPVESFAHAQSYLGVYFLGVFSVFGYNVSASNLRGTGNSRVPLYALIISSGLNIGLDLLFVVQLDMGVAGASLATVIAQFVSWMVMLGYAARYMHMLRFRMHKARFHAALFWQCLRIGLPAGVQHAFVAIGMGALYGMVNGFGVDAAAGYGTAMRIDSFVSLPAMNFAAALSTFVGQNIGAGRMDRVKRGFYTTLLMSGGVSIVVSLLVMIFRVQLITLFTDAANTHVIAVGSEYLTIICSFYVLFSTMFVCNGLLRGAGSSVAPMVFSLVGLWLVRMPIAYWLSHTSLGYKGIFWAIPMAWAVGMSLSLIYYRMGGWRKRSVALDALVADYK